MISLLIFATVILGPIGLILWYKLQKEKLKLKAESHIYQTLHNLQETIQKQDVQIQNLKKRIEALETIAVTPKWEESLRNLPVELTESEKAQLLADFIKSKQLS